MSHRDLQRFTRYGLRLSDRFSHSGTWAPSPYPYRFGSVPLPINVSAVDLATGRARLGYWRPYDLLRPFPPSAFERRFGRRW
jgi:hypothetical protein